MESVKEIYSRAGGNISADTFKNNTEIEIAEFYKDYLGESPCTEHLSYKIIKDAMIQAIVTRKPIPARILKPGELS